MRMQMALRRVIRLTVAVACCAAAAPMARSAPREAGDGALTELLRDRIARAAKAVGRAPGAITDDTRLAIAAAGLADPSDGEGVILRGKRGAAYAPEYARVREFDRVAGARQEPRRVALALSLALNPPPGDVDTWRRACSALGEYGAEFDRVLVGVLGCPDGIPLLPSLQYAAADVLAARATPQLLSLFNALADSGDAHLRSRALIAIGVVCCRQGRGQAATSLRLLVEPREHSVSATQQRMIDALLQDAAQEHSYRIRAAAAIALGLRADPADTDTLERLIRDRAYTITPGRGRSARTVLFPVRAEAARALARLGRETPVVTGGTLAGRELRDALRGGQDVTRDQGGLRRDRTSTVPLTIGAW